MSLYDEVLNVAAKQRTVDWQKVRLGRFTSSEMYKLLTEPKDKAAKERGELSPGAKTYVLKKIAEKITGSASQVWSNAIAWGEDHENEAIEVYERKTGVEVERVNFVPYGENAGGSPDGYVGEIKIIEAKCPYESSNHVLYHTFKTATDFKKHCADYYWQVQSNMLFTKRPECDFISYDPRFPEKLNLKVLTIEADEVAFERIIRTLNKAEEYRQEIISSLKENAKLILLAHHDQYHDLTIVEKG